MTGVVRTGKLAYSLEASLPVGRAGGLSPTKSLMPTAASKADPVQIGETAGPKAAKSPRRERVAPGGPDGAALRTVPAARGRALERRRLLGLTRPRYATLAGVSERTLATVESTGAATPAVRRQLTELDRLLAALCDAVQPAALGPWLFKPNPAFENRSPAAVLAAGEGDRLWQAAHLLRSGGGY